MASKLYGTCTGTTGSRYDTWLEITQLSQDIAAGTSSLRAVLKVKRNDGYAASAYNLYPGVNTASITVDGVTAVSVSPTVDTRNGATATLATWTGTVTHAADGTKTVAFGAAFTVDNTGLSGGSVSGSFVCTTIQRASTFTLSASSVAPGAAVTMTVSPRSSAFTHRYTVSLGAQSASGTLAAGVTTASLTVPNAWLSEIPSSRSGTVSVTLSTYRGSSLVGKTAGTFRVTVPDTAAYRPSFSIAVTRGGSVPAAWNCYVKGRSTVTVAVQNLSLKYGASQSVSSVTVDGVSRGAAPVTVPLTASGTVTVAVTVRDSRNLSSTQSTTVSVEPYAPPQLSDVTLTRCEEDGTANPTGLWAKAVFTKTCSSVGGHNTAAVTVRWRVSGGAAFTVASNDAASPLVFGGGALAVASSYETEITVTDTLGTSGATVRGLLPSASVPFNIRRGGLGAAFGCYAEHDGELTVGYDLRVNGKLLTGGATAFAPTAAVSASTLACAVYPPLDMAFVCGSVTLAQTLAADTPTRLGNFSGILPAALTPLAACAGNTATHVTAVAGANGALTVSASAAVSFGSKLYINGFWKIEE